VGVVNGQKITALRKQKGWDQYELAREAGIAPSVVSRLERDLQADFKISVVTAVANALGVTVDSLLVETAQVESVTIIPELQSIIAVLGKYPEQVQKIAAGILNGLLSVLSKEE
jgi:transcriptional regulator with XRE-family HTH domain